jgi:hypothetical protein
MANTTTATAQVIVAGHICLDIIPTFEQRVNDLGALLKPGSLVKIGPAVIATGGAISNTGQSLHRLGVALAWRKADEARYLDALGRLEKDAAG